LEAALGLACLLLLEDFFAASNFRGTTPCKVKIVARMSAATSGYSACHGIRHQKPRMSLCSCGLQANAAQQKGRPVRGGLFSDGVSVGVSAEKRQPIPM
jgi:hypothetical protein